MYRVSWKNETISGHGQYTSYTTAKSWVDGMNKRYKEELVHTLEKKTLNRLLTWRTNELNKLK